MSTDNTDRTFVQDAAETLDRGLLEICRNGEPMQGPKGEAILVDGKPLMKPAKPSYWKELRQWVKERPDTIRRAGVKGDPAAAAQSRGLISFKGEPVAVAPKLPAVVEERDAASA